MYDLTKVYLLKWYNFTKCFKLHRRIPGHLRSIVAQQLIGLVFFWTASNSVFHGTSTRFLYLGNDEVPIYLILHKHYLSSHTHKWNDFNRCLHRSCDRKTIKSFTAMDRVICNYFGWYLTDHSLFRRHQICFNMGTQGAITYISVMFSPYMYLKCLLLISKTRIFTICVS